MFRLLICLFTHFCQRRYINVTQHYTNGKVMSKYVDLVHYSLHIKRASFIKDGCILPGKFIFTNFLITVNGYTLNSLYSNKSKRCISDMSLYAMVYLAFYSLVILHVARVAYVAHTSVPMSHI